MHRTTWLVIVSALTFCACATAPTPGPEPKPEPAEEAQLSEMKDVSGSPVRAYLYEASAYEALRLVDRDDFVLLWVGEPRRVTAAVGVDTREELFDAVASEFGLECVLRDGVKLCSDDLPQREPMPTAATERPVSMELYDVAWSNLIRLFTKEGLPLSAGEGVDGVRFSMRIKRTPMATLHEALVYLARAKVDTSADPPVVSTAFELAKAPKDEEPSPSVENCRPVYGPHCDDAASITLTGVLETEAEGARGAMLSCDEARYHVRANDRLTTGELCAKQRAVEWRVDRFSTKGLVLVPFSVQDEDILVPPAAR